jgi:hypothetical protein
MVGVQLQQVLLSQWLLGVPQRSVVGQLTNAIGWLSPALAW